MIQRTGVTRRLAAWVVAIVAVAAVWVVRVDGAAATPLVWSLPALIDTAPSGEAFGALFSGDHLRMPRREIAGDHAGRPDCRCSSCSAAYVEETAGDVAPALRRIEAGL